MKPEAILPELEEAAKSLGVKVSYERIHTNVGVGGLCRVRGEYRVIIDKRTSAHDRVATLARALARVGESGGALSPEVEDLLRQVGALRAS
jgi:hypothetical protein